MATRFVNMVESELHAKSVMVQPIASMDAGNHNAGIVVAVIFVNTADKGLLARSVVAAIFVCMGSKNLFARNVAVAKFASIIV